MGLVAVALYGTAMAGIGFAAGGLTRPSLAAPTVAAVTIGTFLVQLLAPALGFPDWVEQLALSDPWAAHSSARGMRQDSPRASSSRSAGSCSAHGDCRGETWRTDRPAMNTAAMAARGCSSSIDPLRLVEPQDVRLAATPPAGGHLSPAGCGHRARSPGSRARPAGTAHPRRRRRGLAARDLVADPAWDADVVERFDNARNAEYDEMIESVERFEDEIRRETRKKRFRFAEPEESEADWTKLGRWFARLLERDFFGASGRTWPRRR